VNTAEAAAVTNILRAVLGEPTHPDRLETDARYIAERITGVRLSTRQRDVLELLAEGLTEEHIARRLNVSASTVKTHKGEIFKHLHARSTAHAVAIGFRKGFLR
jgi:DNA-binding NarL/FixJ family response regulator